MAKFPVISWPIEFDGSASLAISEPTVGTTNVNVATSGTVWSFATETNGLASSDSLARHLTDKLGTGVADLTEDTATTDYLVDDAGGDPAFVVMRLGFAYGGAATSIGMAKIAGSIDETDVGIKDGGSIAAAVSGGAVQLATEINCANWWHSGGIELTKQFRTDAHDYDDYGSVYDPTVDETAYYARRQLLRLLWEQVDDANVYGHRAADSGYASLAGRDVDDPNNLLDGVGGLLDIYARGETTFRVYFGHGDYITVRKQEGGSITSLDDWVTEFPDDPRRSTVDLRGFKITG